MDNYILNQMNEVFIQSWNEYYGTSFTTKQEVYKSLKEKDITRMIKSDVKVENEESGQLCFYTSGTSGHETFFKMKPEFLFGKYAKGLGQMYEELFNVTNHGLKTAICSFPIVGSPLGLKHLFALLELGVDVFPAGNRNFDFTPQQIVSAIEKKDVDMIISRAPEVELYGRIAKKRGVDTENVMAILMTGEVVGQNRIKHIEELFPNAIIRSVYGLTEINSGLFSCECGNYHFKRNGQTVVDLEQRKNSKYSDIYFTVLRPDIQTVRYSTRDVGTVVNDCSCSQGGAALNIKGRNSDEVAHDFFLLDLSELLFDKGYEHNVFADITPEGEYHIIIKSSELISDEDMQEIKSLVPTMKISNYLYDDADGYIIRTKSCTLHRGVGKYEIPKANQ